MPETVFKIRILMASPGNLSKDREKVFDIVRHINLDSGQRDGFVAEIVSWETHTRPAAGEYTQAVINNQFPDDIDIFVGMLGMHFGTPTKKWGSGTEEEFQIAYESWTKTGSPEIMFYFSDAVPSIRQIDPDQLAKRNAFQIKISELGVYYFHYKDIVEFQFDLHKHISSAIHHILKTKSASSLKTTMPDESASALRNYEGLVASNAYVHAISLLNEGTDHLDAYSRLTKSLNMDVNQLTRVMQKETRNIKRSMSKNNHEKALISIGVVNNELLEYSKKLIKKIPKVSYELSNSIMPVLRLATMVKDNDELKSLPLENLIDNLSPMRSALEDLIATIASFENSFSEWPEELVDLNLQKITVIALHNDLGSCLRNGAGLIDRLRAEI